MQLQRRISKEKQEMKKSSSRIKAKSTIGTASNNASTSKKMSAAGSSGAGNTGAAAASSSTSADSSSALEPSSVFVLTTVGSVGEVKLWDSYGNGQYREKLPFAGPGRGTDLQFLESNKVVIKTDNGLCVWRT